MLTPEKKDEALEQAVDWLLEHYEEACNEALNEDYLGGLEDDGYDRLEQLPEEMRELLEINAHEWLLSEAEIEVDGEGVRVSELVLGPAGPPFGVEQRHFLSQLAARPLGLYEIDEVEPGKGFWVEDLLGHEDPSRLWVSEIFASRSLEPGDTLGLRLIPGDEWETSGVLYPIPPDAVADLREQLLEEIDESETPADVRETIGVAIVDTWLEALTAAME